MKTCNSNLGKCVQAVDEAIGKFIKTSNNFNFIYRNSKKSKTAGETTLVKSK